MIVNLIQLFLLEMIFVTEPENFSLSKSLIIFVSHYNYHILISVNGNEFSAYYFFRGMIDGCLNCWGSFFWGVGSFGDSVSRILLMKHLYLGLYWRSSEGFSKPFIWAFLETFLMAFRSFHKKLFRESFTGFFFWKFTKNVIFTWSPPQNPVISINP
jgi:hypothetical protein